AIRLATRPLFPYTPLSGSDRSAEPAAETPCGGKPDDAERGADQATGFEQVQRQKFGDERRRHVEAAAVFVEIDERQRARIGKARSEEHTSELQSLTNIVCR